MPNWVKTCLKLTDVSDERFAEIAAAVKTDDRDFDFEKIIPMPADIFRGDLLVGDMERTKGKNWYDWSIENWGTKWNAHECMVDNKEHAFWFETAWNFAMPVVREFAKMFGCAVNAKYADEDYGNNCGEIIFDKNGKVFNRGIAENSPEAFEIVEELWDVTLEDLEDDE